MPTPAHVARLPLPILAAVLCLLTACGTPRSYREFSEQLAHAPGQGVVIPAVPPLPPSAIRNGAHALNSVVQFWGKPALAFDHAAARAMDLNDTDPGIEALMMPAEDRDLWAYAFYGSVEALQARLVAGIPVLVMLQDDPGNRGARRYALVLGFNQTSRQFLVDEGRRHPAVMATHEFNQRWRPVRRWMMVVVPPERADWIMSMREHVALARYWERKERWADAIREYDEAQKHLPPNTDLMIAKALIWQRTGALDQAELIYRDVLAMDGLKARAANNLAMVLVDRGRDLPEAEKWVRRALTIEPSNPLYLDTLGHVMIDTGRPREAAEILARAVHRSRLLPVEEQRLVVDRLIKAYIQSGQSHLARQVMQDYQLRDPAFDRDVPAER